MRFTVLVLLAALGMPVQAAPTLSFEPANPTPADTIVLTIRESSPTCPYIVPTSTRFAPPNEIRVAYSKVPDCGFGPFSEAKASLGQLPAGTYTVRVTADFAGMPPPPDLEVFAKELTVSFPAGAGGPNATAPLENFGGHYLTGQFGEGVFIEQFGDKSFLTLVTYDSGGRPTWVVMPAARWGYNTIRGRFEFTGLMYRTRRGPESPPSLTVTPVGTGFWYPTAFDTVELTTTVDENTNRRTLRRYRF